MNFEAPDKVTDRKPVADLTSANESPWYTLITLYGEQVDDNVDQDLHTINRRAWNAWARQGLSAEEQEVAAQSSGIDVAELRAWDSLKDEITERHKSEMMARNGADFAYPGIPGGDQVIDLSKIEFGHQAVWDMAVFRVTALFASAKFHTDASFCGATFCANASFASTTFDAAASFASTQFRADAWFDSATFRTTAVFDLATFHAPASFGSTTFCAAASFSSIVFCAAAWFQSASFRASTSFTSATFRAAALFAPVTFSSNVSFSSAIFRANAWFDAAIFEGPAQFVRTKFLGVQSGDGTHSENTTSAVVTFGKPISFRNAEFRHRSSDFTGAIQHDGSAFTVKDIPPPIRPDTPPKQGRVPFVTGHPSLT